MLLRERSFKKVFNSKESTVDANPSPIKKAAANAAAKVRRLIKEQ
jgi:hypothetical protein